MPFLPRISTNWGEKAWTKHQVHRFLYLWMSLDRREPHHRRLPDECVLQLDDHFRGQFEQLTTLTRKLSCTHECTQVKNSLYAVVEIVHHSAFIQRHFSSVSTLYHLLIKWSTFSRCISCWSFIIAGLRSLVFSWQNLEAAALFTYLVQLFALVWVACC